jgi:serine/threonine-protein kinase
MPAPCTYCGSTAGPEHPCPGAGALLVGKTLDGRYEIDDILGQGGMGMVYRAIQTSVQRPVAIKTLHAALATAPTFYERFRREAEVASRLSHPNVITVYDFGRAPDGTCYFVMELLEGMSLKELVKGGGPLSLRRTLNIIEQAARGLAHAHAMGAVHRDLKPHNIMVQALDGTDYVKVLDFGLVKALEQEEEDQLTSTGQVLGTPQYMPPEQAGGEDVDVRSDLYSLGGVFFYCLTGGSPFGANTVRKALMAALNSTVPSVNSKREGAPVPREVDEFLRKALAREKKDRHQSAEEFIDDMLDSVANASDEVLDAIPNGAVVVDAGGNSSARSGSSRSSRSSAGSPLRRGVAPARSRSGASSSRAGSGSRGSGSGSSSSRGSGSDPRAEGRASPEVGGMTVSSGGGPRPTRPAIPSQKIAEAVREASGGPTPRSGLLVKGIIGAAALAFALTGAVVFLKARQPAPAPAVTPTPLPIATPSRPEPNAPSESVLVQLRSNPPGAFIYEDGQSLGQTPTTLRFSRSKKHALELRLQGYETHSVPLDLSHLASSATQYSVSLTKEAPEPVHRPEPKKPRNDDIPIFQ